jgi:hypothetical protein
VESTLDKLIRENVEGLVDGITKDAVRQIPSYREAPLKITVDRIGNWLRVLATSLHENDPQVLEKYLVTVAHERYAEPSCIISHSLPNSTYSNISPKLSWMNWNVMH